MYTNYGVKNGSHRNGEKTRIVRSLIILRFSTLFIHNFAQNALNGYSRKNFFLKRVKKQTKKTQLITKCISAK